MIRLLENCVENFCYKISKQNYFRMYACKLQEKTDKTLN